MLVSALALAAFQAQFSPAPLSSSLVHGARAMAVGELTAATGLECVVYTPNGGFRILERDPATGAWSEFGLENAPDGILGLDVTDVDADGRNDIVCLGYSSGVLFADSAPGAVRPRFEWVPFPVVTNVGLKLVALGDLDGDGDGDLVVTDNSVANPGYAVLHTGPRAFSSPLPLPVAGEFAFTAGDMDQDGDLELVTVSSANGLRVLENDGGLWTTVSSQPWQSSIGALALDDLDADGDLDVVATRWFEILTYTNDGTGALTLAEVNDGLGAQGAIDLVDMDGDGDRDLLARTYGILGTLEWNARWTERTGTYTFASTNVSVPTIASILDVGEVADLDGDGLRDIIGFAEFGSPYVHAGVLDAGGTPTFDPVGEELTLGPPAIDAARFFDADDDGDLDLATAHADGLWLAENRAPGHFADTRAVALALHTTDPAFEPTSDGGAVALRADGVLVATEALDLDADPTFTALVSGLATSADSLVLLDYDGDGDDDVAVIRATRAALQLVERLGPNAWAAPVVVTTTPAGDTQRAVIAGDWDGDGRDDLALLEDGLSGPQLRTVRSTASGFVPGAAKTALATPPRGVVAEHLRDNQKDDLFVLDATSVTNWSVDALGVPTSPRLIVDGLVDPLDFDLGHKWSPHAPRSDELRVVEADRVRRFHDVGFPTPIELEPIEGVPYFTTRLVGADVDNDGDEDTVVCGARDEAVFWYASDQQYERTVDFCEQTLVNSIGLSAELRASSARRNHTFANRPKLRLDVHGVPPGTFGLLLVARWSGYAPAAHGTLCLGGTIGRFDRPGEVFQAGPGGAYGTPIDHNNIPLGNNVIIGQPFETWFFQARYRDAGASRLTNAVSAQL